MKTKASFASSTTTGGERKHVWTCLRWPYAVTNVVEQSDFCIDCQNLNNYEFAGGLFNILKNIRPVSSYCTNTLVKQEFEYLMSIVTKV